MMLLWFASLSLLAQTPAPVKATVGAAEVAYLYAPGKSDAALVVLPNQIDKPDVEWKSWSEIAATRGWHIVMPVSAASGDNGAKMLDAIVSDVRAKNKLTGAPFYLVGAGPLSPMVMYVICRAPHIFSAGLAIGGSAKPAVDTDRLFAANTSLTPIAWALTPEERAEQAPIYQKMVTRGFRLEILESPTILTAMNWLAKHTYTEYPLKIDCETGNPSLARCYWIQPTDFDPTLRNDALPSTRIAPEVTASLDFGGFGYSANKPGPGVVVEFLPENYKGPLKLGDRLVALSGKTIQDPKHYIEMMSEVREEKPVAVTIERMEGKEKDRIRLVTRYVLRKREEVITTRIQAEYLADAKEIVIVTRTVAALRVTVPEAWAPATINWNGQQVATPHNAGCYQLSLKEGGASKPCPQP